MKTSEQADRTDLNGYDSMEDGATQKANVIHWRKLVWIFVNILMDQPEYQENPIIFIAQIDEKRFLMLLNNYFTFKF